MEHVRQQIQVILWWLVCCVTAAQCHKLFFHWAAKNSN